MFDAFRENGFPTYYPENKTAWEADILTSGIIFAFVILGFSLYVTLPGFRGWEKFFLFARITISLFIGAVILVTNFTQTWETAETYTRTKYKAGTGQDVNVIIGVNIGLKGVNITLKGASNQIKGEVINYNEHFSWNSQQGRQGFGPHAGRFNQEYRAAQFRGLPLPILWIAEYFTIDGEGIRWGRYYRQAGFFAHILLWLSFPLWALSNILFFVLLRYGAMMLGITGVCMLGTNAIWSCYRNYTELVIPFTAHSVLKFSFGGSFWVVFFTGFLCVCIGVIVFILDKLYPAEIALFFGVSVLQDAESVLEEEVEEEAEDEENTSNREQEESSDDDNELYLIPELAIPPQARSADAASVSQTRQQSSPSTPVPSVSPTGPQSSSSNPTKINKMIRMFSSKTGPSFRSRENRLTARLQRPRRKDPTKSSPTQSSIYTNVTQAFSPTVTDAREMEGATSSRCAGGQSIELTNIRTKNENSVYSIL